MKKITFSVVIFMMGLAGAAQDITGQWNGVLKVQGLQLRLVFNITKTETGFSATMDSPDQNANGIPVTSTIFENNKLTISIVNAGIEYNGEFKDTVITGVFKQGAQQLPLDLSRKKIDTKPLLRPQEPVKPYPYYTEVVTFQNTKAAVTLAGTLTLPAADGVYPVVILITGSGPQNRDEELLAHKPFLVIADYLTRNGIAVLRYDDRGTAHSTGDFKTATSADFATDVEAAIAWVKSRKEINKKRIGLLGHSEGGLIAPMVASTDKDVNFIVLLAGPGLRGDKLLLLQQELVAGVSGMPADNIKKSIQLNEAVFKIVIQSDNTAHLKKDVTNYLQEMLQDTANAALLQGMTKEVFIQSALSQVTTPWMQYFLKYDPVPALEKLKCAVLAVNGANDLQVPPKEDLAAISAALQKAGNKQVTIKEFPGLNHLFQESATGSPAEYAAIEQTFSPVVLDYITKWIKTQVK